MAIGAADPSLAATTSATRQTNVCENDFITNANRAMKVWKEECSRKGAEARRRDHGLMLFFSATLRLCVRFDLFAFDCDRDRRRGLDLNVIEPSAGAERAGVCAGRGVV